MGGATGTFCIKNKRRPYKGSTPVELSKTTVELSAAEAKSYVNIASEAIDIASDTDYRTWIATSVRKLFPHTMFIAGVVRRQSERVAVDHLLPAGFPTGFIEAVTARHGHFICPTLEMWFQQGRPQLFEPTAAPPKNTRIPDEFKSYDIKNVAAHGVFDRAREAATYFSFSQIPDELNARHGHLLELLAPHLDRTYLRVLSKSHAVPSRLPSQKNESELLVTQRITAREVVVLHELFHERSNKTIARALQRSPDTIKHQIHSILLKLGASDRTEAVTTAIRLGILPDRRSARTNTNPQ